MKKNTPPKSTIFKIRNKYIHLMIASYLPKTKVLKIAQISKKLRNILNLTKEDYDIYFLESKGKEKTINFINKDEEKSYNYLNSITEITQSTELIKDNCEIKVPLPILSILETNNYIIGSTQLKILIFDKNTMGLIKEFDSQSQGAAIKLVHIKEDIIAYSSFLNSIIIIDLKKNEILSEITGSSPLLYESDKLAYIWKNKEIRFISLGSMMSLEEIQIGNIFKGDCEESNIISYMIKTKNSNILISTWALSISEYNVNTRSCVYTYLMKIEFIDYLYQLEDERLIILAQDSSKIYIFDKYLYEKNKNRNKDINSLSYLVGHNKTVVNVIQLEQGQLVSASNDGKLIFWIKYKDNSFRISIVLFLYHNYIRSLIQLKDKRLCVVSDDKVLRIVGLRNKLNDIKIKYIPLNKNGNENSGNYFKLNI